MHMMALYLFLCPWRSWLWGMWAVLDRKQEAFKHSVSQEATFNCIVSAITLVFSFYKTKTAIQGHVVGGEADEAEPPHRSPSKSIATMWSVQVFTTHAQSTWVVNACMSPMAECVGCEYLHVSHSSAFRRTLVGRLPHLPLHPLHVPAAILGTLRGQSYTHQVLVSFAMALTAIKQSQKTVCLSQEALWQRKTWYTLSSVPLIAGEGKMTGKAGGCVERIEFVFHSLVNPIKLDETSEWTLTGLHC